MNTVAFIVLTFGVVIVPIACAYIVMERLARRREKRSGTGSGDRGPG